MNVFGNLSDHPSLVQKILKLRKLPDSSKCLKFGHPKLFFLTSPRRIGHQAKIRAQGVSMKKLILVLFSLTLVTACSKGKKENGLHDTHQNLPSSLDNRTPLLPAEAEQLRTEKISDLTNRNSGLNEKILAAAGYFQAMEYQSQNNKSLADMENLWAEAIEDFLRRLADIHREVRFKKMSPLKDSKRQTDEMAFYALAATMHLKTSNKALSIYELINQALKKTAHQNTLHHEELLLRDENQKMVVDLLKARVDILSALALETLTDDKHMSTGQKFRTLLFKVSAGKMGKMDIPTDSLRATPESRKQEIELLEQALKTQRFLSDLGTSKVLEKRVRSALGNVKLDQQDEMQIKIGSLIAELTKK
jgi:hypothetical protein